MISKYEITDQSSRHKFAKLNQTILDGSSPHGLGCCHSFLLNLHIMLLLIEVTESLMKFETNIEREKYGTVSQLIVRLWHGNVAPM